MILYWKSNSKTELEFTELIKKTTLALMINKLIYSTYCWSICWNGWKEYNDEQISTPKVTTDGEVIPEDNCHVNIKSIWIDELVNFHTG